MGDTNIEWATKTWNPIVGCSLKSPGCARCYAMPMAARLERMGVAHYAGLTNKVKGIPVFNGKVVQAPDHILRAPLGWKKPQVIFVNSMGDLFHENVPFEWLDPVFAIMALAPQHVFIVLTKRPERMREYLTAKDAAKRIVHEAFRRDCEAGAWMSADHEIADDPILPLANVWLGVSAEDQTRANERIPILLDTPAANRFVSLEPLLGPIDLTGIVLEHMEGWRPDVSINALEGWMGGAENGRTRLDWVIVGGESGRAPRDNGFEDNARAVLVQCRAAGVPFFGKQNVGKKLLPEDLAVREWPLEPEVEF